MGGLERSRAIPSFLRVIRRSFRGRGRGQAEHADDADEAVRRREGGTGGEPAGGGNEVLHHTTHIGGTAGRAGGGRR
eukprot:5820597-Pyramimonas_sp.AAC.1